MYCDCVIIIISVSLRTSLPPPFPLLRCRPPRQAGNARQAGEGASAGSRSERYGNAAGSVDHADSLSRDRNARRAGSQGFGGMRSRSSGGGFRGGGFRGGRRR